jgi:hypothetical protein
MGVFPERFQEKLVPAKGKDGYRFSVENATTKDSKSGSILQDN